jgi:hypothetical protein
MPEVNFEVNQECRTNPKGGHGKTTFSVGYCGRDPGYGSTPLPRALLVGNYFSILRSLRTM